MRRIVPLVLVLLLAAIGGGLLWARRPATAFESVPVVRATIESSVTALGVLQPRRYVDVGAQVSGQILRLQVQPGDVVTKGQLLVEIDPSVQRATVDAGRASLAGLRAQLADQRAQHRLAGQQHARQRQMASDGATREEDVQGAEATLASAAARIDNLDAQIAQTQATLKADEARLGYTRIYAPMTGTVVSVEAREGQTLNATYQTPSVLRIADLSSMTVWSEVSEADVRRVKAGMPVYFTTLGADQRRWQGTVRQLLPAPPTPAPKAGGSESGATPSAAGNKVVVYTALFDVDNADGALMPQMTAQVAFVEASAKDVAAVPAAALVPVAGGGSDRFTARVLRDDGTHEIRPLRIGVRNRVLAEVVHGAQVGDRIVTGDVVKP
ncbi:efflux RND transporter periplasmic adaptor subunit [Variovorax sp. ZS18.2.2]|uniref:efflux RND transporter periplasmic adaptor subunit n=1 Tax=Variovorax sp. ZS18.2.2 TaxID=2971255 RepID=UPI0021519493|nr:efflux RND transporter periplasmic adaptor subunit [Variovorax sp. ZS18.2.2]MCR6476696.1 efflux RND transporter periplasmic adaptor subunit [Variovorax sp. ZS18.2.2]